MKHKEKWLEYACQYQTMGVKEYCKVVFLDEKKFNLDRSTSTQKIFQERITQQGLVEEDLLWFGGVLLIFRIS